MIRTNKMNLWVKSIPIIVLTILSSVAQAEDRMESRSTQGLGYLGLLAGGNKSASSETNATPTFGLTLGAKLAPAFGIGFLGSYYGQTSSGSLLGLPTGSSAKTLVLAGQANYFIGGLHLGGEIGTAISSWSGQISKVHTGDSTTSMIYGPEAGYDFIIARSVSLGAEGHYLISTAESAVDNIQVFAALKFWQ